MTRLYVNGSNLVEVTQALAGLGMVTRASQEKGGFGGRWKARTKEKLRGLILLAPKAK